MHGSVFGVGLVDILDVAFVSVLLYAGIVALRHARAGLAVVGMGMFILASLIAREVGMQLTAWLLQGFLAIFVVVLVVLFQSELRQVFERIAGLGLRRGRPDPPGDHVASAIARACSELARRRVGALLVLEGDESVDRFVTGGTMLDGIPSDVLLLSLFEPSSPAHDGALVIRGARIVRFAAHLPLSDDREQLARRGTRHAAALGLAERTDALCIVVSEERGTISIARDGRLRELASPDALVDALHAFRRGNAVRSRRERLIGALRERWGERLAAVGLAAALWLVLVPGAQTIEVGYDVPIVVQNVPEGWVLDRVEPDHTRVVLSGPRRAFVFVDPGDVGIEIDAIVAALGRRTFELGEPQVRRPAALQLLRVDPARVKLALHRASEPEHPTAP